MLLMLMSLASTRLDRLVGLIMQFIASDNINTVVISCWQFVLSFLTNCNKQCKRNFLAACLQTCYTNSDIFT